MSRTFVCSSCGKYDFDALFDLRFKNQLCCEYVFVDEGIGIHYNQTFLVEPPAWMFWSEERCEKAMEYFRTDGSDD